MYCIYVQGKYAKLNTVSSTYIHLVNSIKIIKINLDFKVILISFGSICSDRPGFRASMCCNLHLTFRAS